MDTYLHDKAHIMLITEEGNRAKPYRDSKGILTIGVGRNLEANGIRQDEAALMLDNDLAVAEEDAQEVLGDEFYSSLSDNRKLAFINLAFNLGRQGLANFKETIALCKALKWKEAGEHLLANTVYGKQLSNRAHRVAIMLETGDFPY